MFKKIIAIILLVAFSSLILPHSARAGAWGEDIYSSILKQMLEEMYIKIKETVIANLKIAAIRIVQARLGSLIGGSGMGGPRFVTNWRDDIYGSARNDSSIVVNNYFQSVKSGTGNEGRRIVETGEKLFMTNPASIRPNIDTFAPRGLVTALSPDNPAFWRVWNEAAKPQNRPELYTKVAGNIYSSNFGELSGANTAALQASKGVKSTTKEGSQKVSQAGGSNAGKYGAVGYGSEGEGSESISEQTITMPGSIIGDIWTEVQNMPTKMLTFATSIPEIASSMVSQMITQTIQQGVTNINSRIDQQINQFVGQSGLPVNQIQGYIQGGGMSIPSLPNMPSIPNIPIR